MRVNHGHRLSFFAGFFVISGLGSALIAGLSDVDKFIPGYNDKDNSIDVGIVFWCILTASLLGLGGTAYKATQNTRSDEVHSRFHGSHVKDSYALQATDADESTSFLRDNNRPSSGVWTKLGWGLLGSYTASAAFLIFLHIVRHAAEQNSDYHNPKLTHGLIAGTGGVVALAMLTGLLLIRAAKNGAKSTDQACCARLISCCPSTTSAQVTSSSGTSAVDSSFPGADF